MMPELDVSSFSCPARVRFGALCTFFDPRSGIDGGDDPSRSSRKCPDAGFSMKHASWLQEDVWR